MRRDLPRFATVLVAGLCLTAGCGQHVEKKHESLVSPSERGTRAQREPEGPLGHGEAASDRAR